MMAIGVAPETGEEMKVELSGKQQESFLNFAMPELSGEQIKHRIDNLNVSADAKVMLFSFATKAIMIGETVVKVGQKIMELVFKFVSAYPNTSFGLLFGFIVGLLVGGIPLLGWILGPLITPLSTAFGIVMGAKQDFADKATENRIKSALQPFEVLKGAA